jgi:hypothetical protein
VPSGHVFVPPSIAYPPGASGPVGESFQPRPGVRMTRLPSQDLSAEEPREVTMPQPSARRGAVKEGEG